MGGDNVLPLVEIGLTIWPKTGGAKASPAPPLATTLSNIIICFFLFDLFWRPRAEIQKHFRSFLVQWKPLKFASDIY